MLALSPPARAWNALLLVCIAAAVCLAQPDAGPGSEPPTPVILISIDTLRSDHLGAYGYTRIHTPNIDSYAQPGTVFTAVDAQVPLTLPSHASLFTSTYPFENRIEENAQPLPPGVVTLASVLHSQGYKTAAFIGSVFLERQMGLDQGFDLYDSPFSFDAFSPLSGSMFFTGDAANR
ncbi:MAG: sulfatase-like hydrolase/transferase, partial [Bryobacteraceae bacterium]